MIYSEFLTIAKIEETDIPFEAYKNHIEPMYMAVNLTKNEFIDILNIKNLIKKYGIDSVKDKIIEIFREMKTKLGHIDINDLEANFIELAKEFCKIKNYKYCYMTNMIYEFPALERGCTMYTGFMVKNGDSYINFKVIDDELIEIE